MARTTKKTKAAAPRRTRATRAATPSFPALLDSAQKDIKNNQSAISVVLGILILVVLGFSIFNFIKGNSGALIPAQQTTNQPAAQQNKVADVDKSSLPGKYTVKAGDTLFTIAQSYYGDGYQYTELVKANNITDENSITVGQVLDIPKLPGNIAQASASVIPMTAPTASPALSQANTQYVQGGTGGSTDQTEWGEKITGTTYTVQPGDWLSKIAGRAYGDIYQYNKLAEANHISNADVIEPGTVLQIPR